MNKARKNRNPNTQVNARKFGQNGLTKVVKMCVKITPEFVSKGQMDVKRGNMVLKRGQIGSKVCRPALAGVTAGYFWSSAARGG
jgi:hypothetical protein